MFYDFHLHLSVKTCATELPFKFKTMIYRKLIIGWLTLALSVFTLSGVAQSPDYNAIRDTVSNSSSKYYYPLLIGRYRLSDTTLTASDYHYLYYGYPEQGAYRPLLINSFSDSLSMAFGTRVTPTAETFYRIIHLCKVILEQEPFNLRDLNALAFAYSQLGDTAKASRVLRQMDMIVATIKASGSGKTEQSPWYISYYNHAEDILNLMNVPTRRPIILSREVELFPVDRTKTSDRSVKGYYFNFAPIYFHRPDYFEDPDVIKPKRKMEINPLYNPKSKLNTISPSKK
ncbi:MAG: DUF4919 domain-containing protein [Mucinivorans sp.]